MVNRIVKMTFRIDCTEEFLLIFKEYQSRIRAAEGCNELHLLRDTSDPRVFFTYSQWESELYIEKYRHSETFAAVWPRVKVLFAEPAQAWSTQALVSL